MGGGTAGNKRSGELGELKVATKITESGGQVSFPHGDSAEYDLVAEFGGKVSRIQVKTASALDGLAHSIVVARSKQQPYTQIDVVICSVPYGFYVIPFPALKGVTRIRLWEPGTNRCYKSKPTCRWEEYREAWHQLK